MEQEILPHMDALWSYALFLTRDRAEAEDLTQETLLKGVNSFAQFREGTNCKAWLLRIMHNTFLNRIRRKAAYVQFDEAAAFDLNEKEDLATFMRVNRSPEESLVSMLSKAKVREAVEKLPAEFRSVVVLADLQECSYKEISEILGCPIGTVMSRLHRGRKLLRSKLLKWAQEMGLVAEAAAGESGAGEEKGDEKGEDGFENVTPLAAYRGRPAPPAGRTEE
jgi:RNA polymerase sigma-70 factor (ECF subfamily)